MDHFSHREWVDFVRGVLPRPEHDAIERHLESNCADCRETAKIWRRVSETLTRQTSYSPPESAVERVRAAFVPSTPWLERFASAVRAVLAFDSFAQPIPAGFRGAKPSSRQLLHESDPFVIDLRLESDPARHSTSLIGQILDSRNPEAASPGIEVILLSGEHLVQRTIANAAGEFDMGFGLEDDLKLFINIAGERGIGIQLPDLALEGNCERTN